MFQKLIIAFLLLHFTCSSFAETPSQILILHSYSQEYAWTKKQHQAFISKLNSANPGDLLISTEYLDTKRKNYDSDYSAFFYQYLSKKYENYSPDIIYVTDDNALTFVLDNLQTHFPEASIFFSGVNNYSVKETLDRKRMTGVFEQKDISRNLEFLNNIHANVKNILVVGDDSNTYKAIETEVKQQLKRYPDINATFIANHSIEHLINALMHSSSDYVFLTTLGAMTDSFGQILSLDETLNSIANSGNRIIISMEDAYVIEGILGGYVTSGEQQGIAAANLVTRFLSGTAVEDLPVISISPNQFMFNYNVLKAAKITLPDNILDQAIVLNKPDSFYIRHRPVITGSLISLAVILIASLSIFLILLARKNKVIQSTSIQTQELEQIIHERTMQLSDEKRKLLLAQEIAHIGNYIWDIDSDKVTWSDELYRIVGRMPEEFKPSYSKYSLCIHEDDRVDFTSLTKKVLANRNKYELEYRIVRPDGEIRHVHEQGDLKINDQGDILSLVGVVHDITERKTSEIEHLRLQRELNQTYKMEALGQLTGGIAHDFNNILAIISGYTNLAAENCKQTTNTKIVGYLENIELAAARATDLVSQMMVFSRDDKGVNETLSFAPLIEESINMLRSVIPSSIDIEYTFEDELPYIVMDKTQLHQIMMNLAINAKDAMGGVGKLTINLSRNRLVNSECNNCHKQIYGDWIVLKISDTGSGIQQNVVDRIFEPFFTTKAVGQGTGMGLSVLSAIVEGHGGHILIDTRIGCGTTFHLLFPPVKAEAGASDATIKPVSYKNCGMGQKILVVDDEPSITNFISEVLINNGYDCTTCTVSLEALSLVQKFPERFDLIITDQTMPQLLGIDMIKAIWEINPDIQAILTSGYSDTISQEQAENLGIHYFEKPISVPSLLAKINELITTSKVA